jgi:polyisoprenoid-binding protein YceI
MNLKFKCTPIAVIAILALASMSFLLHPDYTNSSVSFKIKNAGIGVDGVFKTFETSIDFNATENAPSSIKATIQVNTIDTGIEGRDNHLRKEEYFNVSTYPTITFESYKILKTTSGTFIAEGKLTIKGVSKDVKIPFTYVNNIFEGTLTLDRIYYGVGGKSLTMSNDVEVHIKVAITK